MELKPKKLAAAAARLAGAVRKAVASKLGKKPEKSASQAPAAAPAPAPAPPPFSLEHLARRLFHASDAIAVLKDLAANVEKRLAADEPVNPMEAFLAHALIDAGLNDETVELPSVSVVRPRTSGMFYVRVNEMSVPYLALLHVVGIEAALNAAYLASVFFGDKDPANEAEVWRFAHHVAASIVAQAPAFTEAVQQSKGDGDGEWAVRKAIASGIECFRLPWRLSARFRANVAAGEVAMECDLAPVRLMWHRTSVNGRAVVPTTVAMQRRSATDYNTRLAILLAACAFSASERIERVWVAGIVDTAQSHSCLFSVCFDRAGFLQLDLDSIDDPVAVLARFGAALDEKDGALLPIQQTFSLEDARFCPPERFDAPEVTSRMLSEEAARALGAPTVAGLAIDEAGRRDAIAREISRRLGASTAENVAAIMELAGDDPDPAVRAAAERTVRKLIEGSISEDVYSIIGEFTGDDELGSAVAQARIMLSTQQIVPAEALLAHALAPQDALYSDSPTVVFRTFVSYVDRVIYNRMAPDAGKTVLLAPAAYLEGLAIHSLCLMFMGRHEEAIARARRACDLSPFNAPVRLQLVRCLEAAGRMLEAADELRGLLGEAHDSVGIGMGYYRMAYFQWELGEVEAAQACYLRALRFLPSALALVAPELNVMALQGVNRLDDISDEAIDELLTSHGIPLAPTKEISHIFFEAMRAALDAEVFPVAKSFLVTLGALERDDVFFGVLRSLEDEPDR